MAAPQNWLHADLENQLNEKATPPPDGSTTAADEAQDSPESPHKTGIVRQWTDQLKTSLRSNTFPPIPEAWKPARYDENDQSIQRIDFHPEGYPRLAAYINSDENFMMCRRFGFLHTRVLLYRQDELRELEDQLVRLDAEDKDEMPIALRSRKTDDAQEGSFRRGLIQQIDDKLKEYDDLVQRCRDMASLKRTTDRNYRSLANWIENEKPLSAEETEFINCDEDFIALCEAQEGGWFDGFIEDMLSKIPCKITRLLFTSAAQRRKSNDPFIRYYSKSRIDTFVRLVICMLAVALLIAPVVLLFNVPMGNTVKVIILLAFTLFFCICISVFTKAKRHEVFGATAA